KHAATVRDIRSEGFQQRTRHYVQRVVRLVGKLPKTSEIEPMAAQVLRIATSLIAGYQDALSNGKSHYAGKISAVTQLADELRYWLGLLHDSKASQDPDLPILRAEGQVLFLDFRDALKNQKP